MVLGLSIETFTLLHVIISLIGIAAGLIVLAGMLTGTMSKNSTLIFLIATVATSITGFLFPFHGFTPAIIVGIISMVLLTTAIAARYRFMTQGGWRTIYIVTAVASLYLNVFVLIVQSFQKIPLLNSFAPTGTEPPFAVAQGVVLLLFIYAGYRALRTARAL